MVWAPSAQSLPGAQMALRDSLRRAALSFVLTAVVLVALHLALN